MSRFLGATSSRSIFTRAIEYVTESKYWRQFSPSHASSYWQRVHDWWTRK